MLQEQIPEEVAGVDCAPYLQRLILEDPDPSSPLYIPKPPPRNFVTLSQAIKEGRAKDTNPLPAESLESSRGVKMRDKRPVRKQPQPPPGPKLSKVQQQMADFHRGMDFAQDDAWGGGSPFGGRGPFGGRSFEERRSHGGGGGYEDEQGDEDQGREEEEEEEDERGGHETLGLRTLHETRPDDDDDEGKLSLTDIEEDGKEYYFGKGGGGFPEQEEEGGGYPGADYGGGEEEYREGGEGGEGEYREGEGEGGYRYKTPMYEPGDEALLARAKRLRERDGIPFHESQDFRDVPEASGYRRGEAGYSRPVAERTAPGESTEPVEGEAAPPRRIKEKFMRDRAKLEELMNSINQRAEARKAEAEARKAELEKAENPNAPSGDPDNPDGDPSNPPAPRAPGPGGARILSGQEIRQQMAMQRLAAAALQAISRRGSRMGKGRRGRGGKVGRGGRVRIMFM